MKIKLPANIFPYIGFLVLGLVLGKILFQTDKQPHHAGVNVMTEKKHILWTCSMHPQIRMNKPGKCPLCDMDLIPLHEMTDMTVDPEAVVLSPEAIQLANIQTSVVTRQPAVKDIRLYGEVRADERFIQNQVAHLPGRVEKLLINFIGENVSKGQVLALLYSPELITAQQELLEAGKMKLIQPEIYAAARERLRAWKLTDFQIEQIEQSGKIQTEFPILANTSGVVTSIRIRTGDYVAAGSVLFEVVDLSRVWIVFDAYESDLLFLAKGSKLSFTVQALPGQTFESRVVFIDPVIDPVTRVAKVRAEKGNEGGLLKPGMYVKGIVRGRLPDVHGNPLVVPRSAVLWTGKRSIVYVKLPSATEPMFRMREVILGPSLGNHYVVEEGLSEGEEIVTDGTFSVDAAAQLAGKPSMMNHQSSEMKDE